MGKTKEDAELAEHSRKMKLFKRHDGEWNSTIQCACGACFTWEAFDDGLRPWVAEHTPHCEEAK